ncbi:MAG TPA: glycosyltransferase family 4 protein [Steroidobacteraceae bacterium]|jgi:glycosyltransferase involved in cell wall biosynthesis
MPTRKLAIVTSHPIQYYAPVFRALSLQESIQVRVFYTWSQAAQAQLFDAGFGAALKWDVPLLEGYDHQFVDNVAKRPGPEHFGGIENPTLRREIEAWQPDALLIYGWYHRSHLQALRHFKGRIPVLFRGDSTLLDRRTWWRNLLRRGFLRWLYRHVDVAIAVGSNSIDYFVWCGVPRRRVALAPHSVDTVRFAENAEARELCAEQWREQLGIDPASVVFLYAGKFQRKKDPGLLLDAFGSLSAGSHLVFVGSGELETDLKARAAQSARVHFLPFQNQSMMPTVYRLGDVFVLPSCGPGETWGLALNEAMASGRTVIASSKVGGARDLIQPGENGWIFESGDDIALTAILRRAVELGRPELRMLGARGQERSARWSTNESARCIAEAVEGCFPRRP